MKININIKNFSYTYKKEKFYYNNMEILIILLLFLENIINSATMLAPLGFLDSIDIELNWTGK